MLPVVLSLVCFGACLIGLAYEMHPVHVADWIFWVLFLVGVCSVAAGGVFVVGSLPTKGKLRRVAVSLRLVEALVDALIEERGRERPRAIPLVDNAERMDRWQAETAERYRNSIRPLIRPVFDDAVACGAISRAVRPFVDGPQGEQLDALRDHLGDAAEQLERRVA